MYNYNCNPFEVPCSNFSDNLIATYFDYWLSKVEIIKDNTGHLIDIFDDINYMRMLTGITPIILNYGNGITISKISDIRYDKNNQPIGGRVQVNLDLSETRELHVIDWNLFKKENKYILKETLIQLGFTNATIIDNEDDRFLNVINDTAIFKVIYFKNNRNQLPSLVNLNKIIWNIHDLDHINERNHNVINTVYFGKSNRKLTKEQASNNTLTITNDGYGAIAVDENDNNETEIGSGFQREVLPQGLNNWDKIKDEIESWEDKFQKYSGMPSEKLSNQRENLGETLTRVARVNATEKQYYKYIKKFIEEYNEYFLTEIIYQFDSLILDNMQLYQSNLFNNENKNDTNVNNESEVINNE